VQHQEHDLGIPGRVLVRVQGLQAFHGLQAEGRGGVVQAEQVGREIHHHVAVGRVVFWYFREDARKEGGDETGQHIDGAGLFADVHDAQPEGHDAGQRQGDVHHRHLGRGKRAVNDALEDFCIAKEQPLCQCCDETDEEETGPDVI